MSDIGHSFSAPSYWGGQVPILWSNDGSHCAYIGKQGDEFIIYQDGKEFARGPITPAGQIVLPLTFGPGGKHLFYMDMDGDKYRVVVDAKPGPSSRYPEQLVISPDGDHYAYVGDGPTNSGPAT